MFTIEDGRKHFYQWDANRKLIVHDRSIKEVHFCNYKSQDALVVKVKDIDGSWVADVPNILLQEDSDIYAYAYQSFTVYEEKFEVERRKKPADYAYTETELVTLESIEKMIAAMKADLPIQVKKYIDANPDNFKGLKGDKGDKGETGAQGLKGDRGEKGDKGDKPVKGVDYFTSLEQKQMVDEVIKDSNNAFNTNVVNKTKEFDAHASNKQQEYTNHIVAKIKEYDDNATLGVQKFNKNAEEKKNLVDEVYNKFITEKSGLATKLELMHKADNSQISEVYDTIARKIDTDEANRTYATKTSISNVYSDLKRLYVTKQELADEFSNRLSHFDTKTDVDNKIFTAINNIGKAEGVKY